MAKCNSCIGNTVDEHCTRCGVYQADPPKPKPAPKLEPEPEKPKAKKVAPPKAKPVKKSGVVGRAIKAVRKR